MTALPAINPGPLASFSVPTEILDLVIAELVSTVRADPASAPNSQPRVLRTLARLSLTSRAWRFPAQRQMVQNLVVDSATAATHLFAGPLASPELAACVRRLSIDSYLSSETWPTPEDLVDADAVPEEQVAALLERLPNLVRLEFSWPTFNALQCFHLERLRVGNALSKLEYLSLFLCGHSDTTLPHQLLSLTTGLRELRLQTNELPYEILPSTRTPIDLLHLTRLTLSGPLYPAQVVHLNLLSRQTLARIETLDFHQTSTVPILPTHMPTFSVLSVASRNLCALKYHSDALDIRLLLASSLGAQLPQLAMLQIGNARQWHVKREWRTPADASPLLPLLPLGVHTLSFVVFEQAIEYLLQQPVGPSLEGPLERVEIPLPPPKLSEWDAASREEEPSEIERVEKLCAQLKVDLVWQPWGKRRL